MRNPIYLRQLKRDLKDWVADGLVDAETADQMLERAGRRTGVLSLATIVATLGVILLGFSAMSFVAANWWGIPKALQLLILFGVMWSAYGGGLYLLKNNHAGIGQAAILLGVVLFGVNIMMIAQLYHISAHYPDGVFVWALGALAAALLVPSRPALGAAFVIGGVWTSLESFNFDVTFHWPYLIFWAVCFGLSQWLRWSSGFHLALLSLVYWLTISSAQIIEPLDWQAGEIIALYGFLWLAVWTLGTWLTTTDYVHGRALERYGVVLFFVSFFLLNLVDADEFSVPDSLWYGAIGVLSVFAFIATALSLARRVMSSTDMLTVFGLLLAIAIYPHLIGNAETFVTWAYSGIFILATVWLLGYGTRRDDKFLIVASFIGFGAEALTIYFRTFDTLLNQSLFFLIGGAILIGLSYLLLVYGRKILRREAMEAAAS